MTNNTSRQWLPEDLQKADEFLQSTIIHLELTGWCQKKAIAEDGSCCLSHAIYSSSAISNNFTPFQRELAIVALYECLPPNSGIITFNDTAGRTFEEIIKLLQDARQWLAAQKGTNKWNPRSQTSQKSAGPTE